jgi:hypothetical protein
VESLPSQEPPVRGFTCRDKGLRLARHSWRHENPVSTGSIAVNYRALGASEVTAATAIVSLGVKTLRL